MHTCNIKGAENAKQKWGGSGFSDENYQPSIRGHTNSRGICRIQMGGVGVMYRRVCKIFNATPTFITTPTDKCPYICTTWFNIVLYIAIHKTLEQHKLLFMERPPPLLTNSYKFFHMHKKMVLYSNSHDHCMHEVGKCEYEERHVFDSIPQLGVGGR